MPRKTKDQNNSEKKGSLLKSLLSLKKDRSTKKDDKKVTKKEDSSKEDVVKTSKKKTTSKKDDKKVTQKNSTSKEDKKVSKKSTKLKNQETNALQEPQVEVKKGTISSTKEDAKKVGTKKSSSEKVDKKVGTKKSSSEKVDKKVDTKKSSSEKVDKKVGTKKSSSKKDDKKVDTKKSSSEKVDVKVDTKKSSSEKVDEKVGTKKVDIKVATKKVTSKKEDKQTSQDVFSPEYYDLPYRYNQTVIKILAQTPKSLFIYWDISDEDRNSLISKYGEHFFEITKPVLIVHNQTMNYSFEVDVNDFTNSWYLSINDSNCKYSIELGRRPIPINYNYIQNYNKETDEPIKPIEAPYIYISSSNDLDAPNDKILFNQNVKKLYFKNVKTNQIIEKDISEFPFVYSNGEFVGIYEIYSNLFKDEEILNEHFNINNPSSGNPGSSSLSSRFK